MKPGDSLVLFWKQIIESTCGCSAIFSSMCALDCKATVQIQSYKWQVCLLLCHQVVVPPPRKRGGRRRRQLVFADPQVQISEREMEEQIGNLRTETLSLVDTLR